MKSGLLLFSLIISGCVVLVGHGAYLPDFAIPMNEEQVDFAPEAIKFSGKNDAWAVANINYEKVIRIDVKKGPNRIFQFKKSLALGSCKTNARISAEIYFPQGFSFSNGVHKIPLGIWGGGKGTCISGGCPPSEQDGFSLRLIESDGIAYLYSYDDQRSQEDGQDTVYGRELSSQTPLPTGRWAQVALEVLSRPEPAIKMLLDEQEIYSAPIAIISQNWCIKGPLLTFMWGGEYRRP